MVQLFASSTTNTKTVLETRNIYYELRNKTEKMHFYYVFNVEKSPLHVSNRQVLRSQEVLSTLYAGIGTYPAYSVESTS